jgi:HptB-dependent secretion and biofilm anti anti-sigma factor
MDISTRVRNNNSELQIIIPKIFGFKDYRHFRTSYMENMQQIEKYIIDFTNTDDLESCGLGMLLQMHEFIDANKHPVSLINCNDKLTNVFRICGFDKIFNIK